MWYGAVILAILANPALAGGLEEFPKWRGAVERVGSVFVQDSPSYAAIALAERRYASVPYRRDEENYHSRDYWASPDEFTARGGDCEDYAIARYFELLRRGFKDSDLNIVIGVQRQTDEVHAVLTVRYGGAVYVLDNTAQGVQPEERLRSLEIAYSINRQGRTDSGGMPISVPVAAGR